MQITKSLAVLTIWSKIFLMILELKLCKYTLNYAPTQLTDIAGQGKTRYFVASDLSLALS